LVVGFAALFDYSSNNPTIQQSNTAAEEKALLLKVNRSSPTAKLIQLSKSKANPIAYLCTNQSPI